MKVGLAVGLGTGPELAAVFTRALDALTSQHGVRVEYLTSDRRYGTYPGQLAKRLPAREVARLAVDDAEHYERFLTDLHAAGGRVVFRTAINAQPLYRVRERLLGVKVERFATFDGELILVRDGAQGFYAGVNDEHDPEGVIRRSCEFRRDTTRRILDHAVAHAAEAWGGIERIDRIQMIYKFHLLDTRFAQWVDEYAKERGLKIHLCQPDTANRQLAREEWRGRVLLIGSNEWSDIMHAELVIKYGHGTQEERSSCNEYLHPRLQGLVEYQTVHGSADDIAERDLANPLATLRAAAAIAELHGDCAGAMAQMEAALLDARCHGLVTRDMGGNCGTTALVEHVLAHCTARNHASAPVGTDSGSVRSRDALVVLDLQNDYCAKDGCFHRLGLVDPERTRAVADVASRLLARTRAAGATAIFVRTVQSEAAPRVVRERNLAQGRGDCVRRGGWGADAFGPSPRPGETVVLKHGYDPFLGTTLENDLRRRGIERLIVVGVFTDMCVDALARSAYQLGFEVVVVREGTLPLERNQAECLSFMERFYGARIVDADNAARVLGATVLLGAAASGGDAP